MGIVFFVGELAGGLILLMNKNTPAEPVATESIQNGVQES
jgi:hypothetical protein